MNDMYRDSMITIKCNIYTAEELLPLLKQLKTMSQIGCSRTIKIEDYDGDNTFSIDGDGPSLISEIRQDGELVKAKKMPINTVSHGRRKVAEGKWVPVKSDKTKKKPKLKSYEVVIKVKETSGKVVDEIIDLRDTDDFFVQTYLKRQEKKKKLKAGFDKLKSMGIKSDSDIDKYRKKGEARSGAFIRIAGQEVWDKIEFEMMVGQFPKIGKSIKIIKKSKKIRASCGDEMEHKLRKEGLYIEGKTKATIKPKELAMGIKEEMEHTKDKKIARQIALDHLADDPDYYSKHMTKSQREGIRMNESKIALVIIPGSEGLEKAAKLSKVGSGHPAGTSAVHGKTKSKIPYTGGR